MPISTAYRTVNIKPVTGPLNMRSQPDQLPLGSFRRRINWEITDSAKPGRARGFQKLLPDASPYNNQDLHDQLLSLQTYYDELTVPDSRGPSITAYPPSADICGTTLRTRSNGQQPVTMLSELVSSAGQRKLMVGTQNRLYVLEESLGNYKIIADAYGGAPASGLPERRWKSPAQVGDISILTNNFDPPMYYQFDGITSGCGMQAISEIEDLALIGLTRARVAFSWRGIVFLGDVTMDGVRYPHRLLWGDKDAPLSFDPAAEGTVADHQDLDSGEEIMGGIALHNYLLVVTTRGIWQLTVSTDTSSNDAPVFNFTKLYSEPKAGERCIVFPNTLCSDGESIYYLGNDAFYRFNIYMSAPEGPPDRNASMEMPWIHASTSIIFEGIDGSVEPIDQSVCEAHIAWYDARSQSIGISWVPQNGTGFPDQTLILYLQHRFASEHDYGVTAGCNFTSSQVVTFSDWLLSLCACTQEELESEAIQELMPSPIKTGGYCAEPAEPTCTPLDTNAPIYTNKALTLTNGVIAEDYTQPEADEGSFCKQFGSLAINDLCELCKNDRLFVFAHATDWCLKQIGPEVYVREMSDDSGIGVACGVWEDEGYEDTLILGPIHLDIPDETKAIRKLELEFDAIEQATPAEMNARIGYATTALDPNVDSQSCKVKWYELTAKDLSCQTPNKTLHWDFYFEGRMLYVELSTSGVGGGYNLSRIGMEIRALPRSTTS